MKIGYERQDALIGARYAVSAHLAEGRAAEILTAHLPHIKHILLRRDAADTNAALSRITTMLTAGGYILLDWDGTEDALSAVCNGAMAPEGVALLTWGDAHAVTTDALALTNSALPMTHLWWMSRPREAFSLIPVGTRPADIIFADPTLFSEGAWEDALPYAVRLGVLFDRHLFSLVYSSFDAVTLLARGCRLTQDLLAEDAGNIRARMAFGMMMAQVVHHLTGGETSSAEGLAMGMLYEVRLGAKLGVSHPKKLTDLEGVLAYHGYPRALTVSGEELATTFSALFPSIDSLTLTLPTTIGKCRTADYPIDTITRLLRTLGDA